MQEGNAEVNQNQLPVEEGSKGAGFDIVFGEVTYHPKYESSIPVSVTRSILDKEQLPEELPSLGSSMIEDFVLERIKSGTTSTESIVDAFFEEGVPARVDVFVDEIQARSKALDWDKIFPMADARKIHKAVLKEMEDLGMTKDQIAAIAGVGVEIREGLGCSSLTEEVAFVNRLQAVRKAIDYTRAFGDSVLFEEVVKTMVKVTLAHELGHKVDIVAGMATNEIPLEWEKDGEPVDQRGERFAEYWGRLAIKGDKIAEDVRHKEWVMQVAKVSDAWNTLRQHNETQEEKIDLFAIFRGIEERLTDKDENTRTLLLARRCLFGGSEPENYAFPYSRDVVGRTVKASQRS